MAAIYLSLRLQADGKEMDEIAGLSTAAPLGLTHLSSAAAPPEIKESAGAAT
jgi:hypothetical protein